MYRDGLISNSEPFAIQPYSNSIKQNLILFRNLYRGHALTWLLVEQLKAVKTKIQCRNELWLSIIVDDTVSSIND